MNLEIPSSILSLINRLFAPNKTYETGGTFFDSKPHQPIVCTEKPMSLEVPSSILNLINRLFAQKITDIPGGTLFESEPHKPIL
jgi:hypothetical protein